MSTRPDTRARRNPGASVTRTHPPPADPTVQLTAAAPVQHPAHPRPAARRIRALHGQLSQGEIAAMAGDDRSSVGRVQRGVI